MNEHKIKEKAFEVADVIYFDFIDSLHDDIAMEYVETDTDNVGGTKNTKKGSELYYTIEDRIISLIERVIKPQTKERNK